MKMSVIGTGYLGATHAAAMAELGHDVVGVDTDAAKVASLAQGKVPFHEPDLPELLSRHVGSGAHVAHACLGSPPQMASKDSK